MPLTMTAKDMNISFKSDPAIFRAIHPIFDGRQVTVREQFDVVEPLHSEMLPCGNIEQAEPDPAFKPASWTWEVTR
jgi:hypothetical protein